MQHQLREKAPTMSQSHSVSCWSFKRRPSRRFRTLFLTLAVGSAVSFAASPASAELLLSVTSPTVLEGQAGYVDVYFEVPAGEYRLAGYMIELLISGPTDGVRFTALDEPENAIFPGRSPRSTLLRPELPGPVAAANDDLPAGEHLISDGAGLIRVWFETDPGSMGVYTVTIDTHPARTNFSDGQANLLPVSGFAPGAMTVVPEPSTAMLLLLGLIGLGACSPLGRTAFRISDHRSH